MLHARIHPGAQPNSLCASGAGSIPLTDSAKLKPRLLTTSGSSGRGSWSGCCCRGLVPARRSGRSLLGLERRLQLSQTYHQALSSPSKAHLPALMFRTTSRGPTLAFCRSVAWFARGETMQHRAVFPNQAVSWHPLSHVSGHLHLKKCGWPRNTETSTCLKRRT